VDFAEHVTVTEAMLTPPVPPPPPQPVVCAHAARSINTMSWLENWTRNGQRSDLQIVIIIALARDANLLGTMLTKLLMHPNGNYRYVK